LTYPRALASPRIATPARVVTPPNDSQGDLSWKQYSDARMILLNARAQTIGAES